MNKKELAMQARNECNDPKNIIHCGKRGKSFFWNEYSRQFMYIPAFGFSTIPTCNHYRYDAVDESGKRYSFTAPDSDVPLTPIWAELPDDEVIRLTVTALNPDGSDYALVGARTFYKLAPFSDNIPPAVRSYEESAELAFRFTMKESFVQHWLKYGTPDPYYDLNLYPSKIISALVEAMIGYGKINLAAKEEAMKVAVNAADWLMSITPRGNHPLADVPPTYYFDFCPDPEKYGIITANYNQAIKYRGWVMMIYPASVGSMYLKLAEATGDKKYANEALKIGDYYLRTVLPSGSWYLVRSEETGEPIADNLVAPMENIVPFLTGLYDATGDEKWKDLCEKAVAYTENLQLRDFNWEGQFEDIGLSMKYENLSQYGPVGLAIYYLKYRGNDPKYVEAAKDLMRFAEDQFVVWNKMTPWFGDLKNSLEMDETSPRLHTPCALEQYRCYAPIDASASHIISGFYELYKAGCGDLYLAKACALADQITRVQEESGRIPTFWIYAKGDLDNFWFNCMFSSCNAMLTLAPYKKDLEK